MNHEKAIEEMDKVFRANSYTIEEERFTKATALSILAQIRVYQETGDEHVDQLLGHTFGSMLQILATDLTDESKTRIQDAIEHFITLINGDNNEHEHRKSH